MRTAAAILSEATTPAGLIAVARAAGLCEQADPLEAATVDALGLDAEHTSLGAAAGQVRVLVLQFRQTASLRDLIQPSLRRLVSRAPHVLWFVAATNGDGTEAGVFALAAESGPRVASFLWQPDHVVDSDAETLCALSALPATDDILWHARGSEVLGRDALTRRFYRALEQRITALAATAPAAVASADARGVSLLLLSRLLFLRFLEAKGWLDGDRAFLSRQFDACMRNGGQYHQRVLLPLFFGTLNTPVHHRATRARALGQIPFLNGGLFARSALERRTSAWRFPDESLGDLFDNLFARFRFVAREDSATWSAASVDPEMLGRAFESLMASAERKAGGVFYTPHALVARAADHALRACTAATLEEITALRVLDPACGSGAFLVYLLERLAERRRELGDVGTTASLRRAVLATSIFGVDLNPMAVWLCELRLWLSVVIESEEADPMKVPPLPNLDRNIRVGDALGGHGFADGRVAVVGSARLERLRTAYVRATGKRKRNLESVLDREERRRLIAQIDRDLVQVQHARRELLVAQRSPDLFGKRSRVTPDSRRTSISLRNRVRELTALRRRIMDGAALPFSFHAFFASAQVQGGFDIVVGNPPWVRLHRVPAAVRVRFRQSFEVFRAASWHDGAAAAGISSGFASQIDLAALFIERSVHLLRPHGVLSLLVPSKLWCSLSGGGVRDFLLRTTRLERLEDLANSTHTFDAAVYPSLVVARADAGPATGVVLALHDRTSIREWTAPPSAVTYDGSRGAPWLLLPRDARNAFDRIRAAGVPLSTTAFGPPRLGVKSGCNSAFVVRVVDAARGLATVRDANGETGTVDSELLRPALRGDGVARWKRRPCDDWILWTHDQHGAPLASLPDRSRAWLRRHYSTLTARSDAVRARRWWSLFRVEAADASSSRVVWADFGRRPSASVLAAGDPTVPLNSCYVLRCHDERDAWAIATILNSPLSAAWLNAIAEPARGGYRRYLGWTVGLLPIPVDWPRARDILADAAGGDDDALIEASVRAYGLKRLTVTPLLLWKHSG
ncbi:MAG TPA: N-6 DNA methylase [Gemmatimonadaceae bacterium]|nr:N-6 DNA methylase [Gemmatimonadaceae bacterium]